MTKKTTTVGNNIRRIRRERGMTPEEFASRLECTMQQVFNYEGGRTRITEEVISKAADILGVTIEELFREVTE